MLLINEAEGEEARSLREAGRERGQGVEGGGEGEEENF